MDINYFLLSFQVANFILLITWIIVVIVAISEIWRYHMKGWIRAMWIGIVVLIPILGAAIFLLGFREKYQAYKY